MQDKNLYEFFRGVFSTLVIFKTRSVLFFSYTVEKKTKLTGLNLT